MNLQTVAAPADPGSGFLSILPRVQRHAELRFAHLSPERLEEATAETVAAAWCFYHRLAARNRLEQAYASPLAARHTAQHRSVGSAQSSRDPLHPRTFGPPPAVRASPSDRRA